VDKSLAFLIAIFATTKNQFNKKKRVCVRIADMSMLKTQKLLDSLILDLEKSLGLPSSKDAKDSGVKGSSAAAPAKNEPAAKEAANKKASFFFCQRRCIWIKYYKNRNQRKKAIKAKRLRRRRWF
jgi:hypothetical protein